MGRRRQPAAMAAAARPSRSATAAHAASASSLRDTRSMSALPMMTPSARRATLGRLLRRRDAEAHGQRRRRARAQPGDQAGQLGADLPARPGDAGHRDAVDERRRGRGDEVEALRRCSSARPWARGPRRCRGGGQGGSIGGRLVHRQVRDHEGLDAGARRRGRRSAPARRRAPCSGRPAARRARRRCARRPARSTSSGVTPASSAWWVERCTTGPSAMGSEKGTPSSTMSAPAAISVSMSR